MFEMDTQKVEIPLIYRKMFPQYGDYLTQSFKGCRSILDLGCGPNSYLRFVQNISSTGVELFRPYLDKSHQQGIHNNYVLADIRKVSFKPYSFDAVFASDVLEHITKEEGRHLLGEMQKWAKRKVIIFTTNGFIDQDRYDKNPLQLHRSGWVESELLNQGFSIYGVNGLRVLRTEKSELKFKPKMMWQLVSDVTQLMTYKYPKFAYQLLCVKDVSLSK
jgi:predicted TPR repeat methyltransferase